MAYRLPARARTAVAILQAAPEVVARSACVTSGSSYTVTVCITAPADGSSITGDSTVSATVAFTGSSPGTQRVVFYLDDEYLITDFIAPYAFELPSPHWIDGTHRLAAEAKLASRHGANAPQLIFESN